ncbi:uncharacterized protein [Scyliorhinus torazame]|uniref:uncharacterized protein isoform X2 n=1 Tax=Scyliorhinus torazame TaxID=75743 RepID=UPI003B5A51C9
MPRDLLDTRQWVNSPLCVTAATQCARQGAGSCSLSAPPPSARRDAAQWQSSAAGAGMESGLPVPQNRNLPAAVTQCFSVVALCTAVADPNWFQVSMNGTSPQIYGVAYVVRLQGNLTADPHTVLNYEGISLLIVMATCSYIAIVTGFGAFILSFLGSRHPLLFNLPMTLHFITEAFGKLDKLCTITMDSNEIYSFSIVLRPKADISMALS